MYPFCREIRCEREKQTGKVWESLVVEEISDAARLKAEVYEWKCKIASKKRPWKKARVIMT